MFTPTRIDQTQIAANFEWTKRSRAASRNRSDGRPTIRASVRRRSHQHSTAKTRPINRTQQGTVAMPVTMALPNFSRTDQRATACARLGSPKFL
jgi:hypothetical protein